ncbi:hypothetical protein LINGRAHAP2_LOCUS9718 [Linum grandiflorum]
MAKQHQSHSEAGLILRTSIHTFLKHFQFFTSAPVLLAFPFAASVLLSQTAAPAAAATGTLFSRLQSLSQAAGFPPSSQFLTILNLKLSQTIASLIFTVPFSLTFLLFAKSSVFSFLKNRALPRESVSSIFWPLLLTHVTNSFVLLSANASAFCLIIIAFNVLEPLSISSSPVFLLLVSALGAVVYSVILANAVVICNLATVVTGMERRGGYMAVLKAAVMIRRRASTALSLALPVNVAMAGIEALFQYRVIGGWYYNNWVVGETETASDWYNSGRFVVMGLEAALICLMYSVFVVLDAIVGSFLYKSIRDEIVGEGLGMEIGYYYAKWKVDDDDEDEEEDGLL